MKTTGMSRRIDNTGRIVIPREIRKQLGIRSGDQIEIFTHDNEIILRKYDVAIGLEELVRRLYDEFTNVKDSIKSETADKVHWHIDSLQELLETIKEDDNE